MERLSGSKKKLLSKFGKWEIVSKPFQFRNFFGDCCDPLFLGFLVFALYNNIFFFGIWPLWFWMIGVKYSCCLSFQFKTTFTILIFTRIGSDHQFVHLGVESIIYEYWRQPNTFSLKKQDWKAFQPSRRRERNDKQDALEIWKNLNQYCLSLKLPNDTFSILKWHFDNS